MTGRRHQEYEAETTILFARSRQMAFITASTLGVQPPKFDWLTQDSRRYYGVFRNPIRAADKWKSEMKTEDIERVYKVLRQSDLIQLYPESEASCIRSTA